MAKVTFAGSFVSPSTGVLASTSNYKDTFDFSDQFYPDLKTELMKIYADQSLTGLLQYFALEEELVADKTIWGEEGRRHSKYQDCIYADVGAGIGTLTRAAAAVMTFRPNDILEIHNAADDEKFIVRVITTSFTTTSMRVQARDGATGVPSTLTGLTVFKIGTEFLKGAAGQDYALTRSFDLYDNKPFIAKDHFEVNGSDLTNISWLEDPAGNEYWYLEDAEETKRRFMDHLEIQALTIEKTDAASPDFAAGYLGSDGYFPVLRERGGNWAGYISDLADLEELIAYMDNAAGEKINMAFFNREADLAFDKFAATLNALHGGAGFDSNVVFPGMNFGMPTGTPKMSDLSWKGIDWSGYTFLKQTWKILKDPTFYASTSATDLSATYVTNGIMCPYGLGTIQNQIADNARVNVPYLTLMYKGKPGYSRRFESFILGSVMNPNPNVSTDKFEIHFRTERLLRTVGARKHLIFEGANA
ncbi:MAG TPA: hypothetical protein VMV77_05675 [Bacteroidales bacterium]|nr:hypothetical protein [Bacteroidales bacterium]